MSKYTRKSQNSGNFLATDLEPGLVVYTIQEVETGGIQGQLAYTQ